MTASGQAIAEGLLWANRFLCIQDESGVCLPEFYDGEKELCSDRDLTFAATIVSTDYGRGHVDEESFQELLSSYPAPANSYTSSYTQPPPSLTPTCRGTTITVQEGDTCEPISRANSVATDRNIADKYMDYSCRELVVGMKLCIQDTCTIAQIQQGQTYEDRTSSKGFTIVQLTS
ncbi:hypothetical protein GCG54_00011641 [Colletotrichum gloeosporioides]|uniref:LysM domain-containing protein n=1 Tax=Colletotrichum gloeosporioides TaxID=474922 RepID=A0A8H4CH91_COLGL|nr:uncharacterized protein GCG54_00011641 [Colletotrichum gloeosporioides]KAF3803804.1 hypothetical protein GCG54_00011641 [Colletotrichum gloeosporioides]